MLSRITIGAKLFASVIVMIVVSMGIAAMSHRALNGITGDAVSLYEGGLLRVESIIDLKANLLEARGLLVTMINEPDEETQKQYDLSIKRLSAQVDETINRMLGPADPPPRQREKLDDIRIAWMSFKETCDSKIIPFIYQGKTDAALALTRGVQARRFKEMVDHANSLCRLVKDQAVEQKVHAEAGATSSVRFLWAMSFGGIAVATFLSFVLARSITSPLRRVMAASERLAAGDLTCNLAVGSKDELGQMSHSLAQAIAHIRLALQDVRSLTKATSSASQDLAAAAADLSSGAQEQASALEESVASLQQLTATVQQSAESAAEAKSLAAGSCDVAETGGEVVAQSVASMNEINHSARRIADIITTIDEIAFQTNLLALNAAVEAARAGEQGRGFAVVAAEVRNLAVRSAGAAKEIKSLIADSQSKVSTGSRLISESGRTLGDIMASVKRVMSIVTEISATAQEQAQGIEQVNKAVNQMDQVVQSNAERTEELSRTAESLAVRACDLEALVMRFTLDEGRGEPAASTAEAATEAL
jgi:methyl-accepting chemotaxis protein